MNVRIQIQLVSYLQPVFNHTIKLFSCYIIKPKERSLPVSRSTSDFSEQNSFQEVSTLLIEFALSNFVEYFEKSQYESVSR